MNKIKILIIDDESRMRTLIKDFLIQKDYEIIEAYDGVNALKLFELHKNNLSLIILDVMMPHIDGYQVLTKIRELSNIPVIMLTAKSEESDELLRI